MHLTLRLPRPLRPGAPAWLQVRDLRSLLGAYLEQLQGMEGGDAEVLLMQALEAADMLDNTLALEQVGWCAHALVRTLWQPTWSSLAAWGRGRREAGKGNASSLSCCYCRVHACLSELRWQPPGHVARARVDRQAGCCCCASCMMHTLLG